MATLSRLDKLRNRRMDPLLKVAGMHEAYEKLKNEDSAVRYAIGAMQPIDPGYTKNSIEARDRVEKQLGDGYLALNLTVHFDYQGSLTNNTHIFAHSDIDLLTIDARFEVIQPPNQPAHIYQGDSIQDLKQLRTRAATILRTAFPAATVDETGSKAINISGGSLRRKIDVIASARWNTVEYVRDGNKTWRGIVILDNEKGEKIPNKPFLHNKRIDDRDTLTNGGLRKLTRLLKSLKYDSDEKIDISSYDIVSIVFNMPEENLRFSRGQDMILVKNCQTYLHELLVSDTARNSIDTPNGMRKVFCAEGASKEGLKQLSTALDVLVQEIEAGLAKSFRKLAAARIEY